MLQDCADRAAVAAVLDLVITLDTSIAHLAGAIGVPTWVILPEQNVDRRWGREGEATGYASMRLLRRAGVAAAVERLDEWCRRRGLEARQDT